MSCNIYVIKKDEPVSTRPFFVIKKNKKYKAMIFTQMTLMMYNISNLIKL